MKSNFFGAFRRLANAPADFLGSCATKSCTNFVQRSLGFKTVQEHHRAKALKGGGAGRAFAII